MAETNRERAFWRIITRLSEDVAEAERDAMQYRQLAQSAMALTGELQKENARLRRSLEAEAAIMGSYPR